MRFSVYIWQNGVLHRLL